VADGKRELLLAPASADGVNITATDTTALDLDVNIVVAEGLGLELVLVEVKPCVRTVDLESGELLGVRHVGEVWRRYGGKQMRWTEEMRWENNTQTTLRGITR
jgi:hypothetical protein